jgi:putative hemolysin
MKILSIINLLLLINMGAALAQKDQEQDDVVSFGAPNPAAKNCTKLGGTLEPYIIDGAQNANCVISSAKLFEAMSKRGLIDVYVEEGTYHLAQYAPAKANCFQIGGHEEVRSLPSRAPALITSIAQDTFCVVSQWKLFHAINILRE